MKKIFITFLLFFIGNLCLAKPIEITVIEPIKEQPSAASEEATVGQWNFSLNLGYGQVESLIVGIDDFDLYLLPNISYYGENFFLENTTIGYSLFEDQNLIIDLVGRLNEDGIYFKFDDFGIFSALGLPPPGRGGPRDPVPEDVDRKLSYLVGVSANYSFPWLEVGAGYYKDITNVHNGYEADLTFSKSFDLNDSWSLYLSAMANYKSKKLINYYYQLHQDEGIIRLFTYLPNSAGINYSLHLSSEYLINDHWSWQGSFKKTYLTKEVSNSLIIDKKTLDSYFVGIKYRF